MNTFGRIFRVSIFGESHGPEVGCVIDGVPAGLALCVEDFAEDIARRSPGAFGTTSRKEPDVPEFRSGLFEGHTTGAPLTIAFVNTNARSADYARFLDVPRPGHSDYSASKRWDGFNDPRGGGHSSGRLTLPMVAAGVVAKKLLPGVSFRTELVEIGGCSDHSKWDGLLSAAASEGDSLGGIIECEIFGVPAGYGEPYFDSVESLISHAVFAIPGIRGIEFGDGFRASAMRGSAHNDPFGADGPLTNGAGGVNGGISNGASLLFRVAVKPTSSISKAQRTWNFRTGSEDILEVRGRHDVCFALRTPVIVETAAAMVLADLKLISGK